MRTARLRPSRPSPAIEVGLTTPLNGRKKYQKSKTCIFPAADDLAGLQNNPSGYDLIVHSTEFGGGAIRGQIGYLVGSLRG